MNESSFKNDDAAGAKVCAVIVTFNPDLNAVTALIRQLKNQVALIVVIDNASQINHADELGALGAHHVRNKDNEGLAAGFNAGIQWALRRRASHVILFDQDSLPSSDMVSRLLSAEQRLLQMAISLAAVGPTYSDVKSNKASPVIGFENFYTKRKYKPDFENFIEAGYLISSGQLIRCEMFNHIGVMKSDLFIDAIDIEWALRARSRGYRSFAVSDASMAHNLGDKTIKIGNMIRATHSPERHYYVIRNAILLCRSKDIPIRWKISDGLKTMRRIIIYPLYSGQALQHIKWMMRGLADGMRGKSGKSNHRR